MSERTEKSYCYKMLAAINDEREKRGIAPLKMNKYLLNGAAVRAPELKTLFDHTRPNGQMCFTAIKSGYSYAQAGENIAQGRSALPNVEQIVNMWMNSSGHRQNILTSSYKDTGIGLAYANGTWYWVQMFGTPWIA